MKTLTFSNRNTKEILRDPLTSMFSLGFPVVLLLLMSAIQANIPVELFAIEKLSPGVAVFGLSFMSLFSATLIARDRESAFLRRLYTTPMSAMDFILGYMLPILPIAICQSLICYVLAFILGLAPSISVIYAIIFIIPISSFYIGLGLLCGSVFNVKQVGGICGALLTNLSAWLSGVWFDLELVGGTFKKIADILPFYHAVELERAIINGEYGEIFSHLWIILAYAAVIIAIAVILFLRQMRK